MEIGVVVCVLFVRNLRISFGLGCGIEHRLVQPMVQ